MHRPQKLPDIVESIYDAGLDPSDVIEDALRRFPEDYAVRFLKARWLLGLNEAKTAIGLLDELLSIDPDRLPPGAMAFDRRIFGSSARELKAAALVKLGDLAAAAALLRQAEKQAAATMPA